MLRKVERDAVAGISYTITTPEIARYCFSGGKPGFSFDERWIVYPPLRHAEPTAVDARVLAARSIRHSSRTSTKGAANIYLMDLATGVPVRITNMQPGQYALYPALPLATAGSTRRSATRTPATST